jgi:hypothetical protein
MAKDLRVCPLSDLVRRAGSGKFIKLNYGTWEQIPGRQQHKRYPKGFAREEQEGERERRVFAQTITANDIQKACSGTMRMRLGLFPKI